MHTVQTGSERREAGREEWCHLNPEFIIVESALETRRYILFTSQEQCLQQNYTTLFAWNYAKGMGNMIDKRKENLQKFSTTCRARQNWITRRFSVVKARDRTKACERDQCYSPPSNGSRERACGSIDSLNVSRKRGERGRMRREESERRDSRYKINGLHMIHCNSFLSDRPSIIGLMNWENDTTCKVYLLRTAREPASTVYFIEWEPTSLHSELSA